MVLQINTVTTSKERFLKALHSDSSRYKLLNFNLFAGTDSKSEPQKLYDILADVFEKDHMGLLPEIDLNEMDKKLLSKNY